ncbi:MAG: DNA-3-methyladenine glycosylase 2 family protein [Actinobacteria bacterium]|jgi:DNA-3-methyladenine glycosylase II|nr:DNA-3-methyladenine glycosylase 2 family protein [Actinomycetota bacterium]NBP90828.1 DNA-3-methyladenine glycosylase 2 family protein [Actinomycetota bacterium]
MTLAHALKQLPKIDKELGKFMKVSPPCELGEGDPPYRNHFETLMKAIVSQQISTKAADSITNKLKLLIDDDFSPVKVLALSNDDLRGAGLSSAKARTATELSEAFVSGRIPVENFEFMPDHEITTALTQVWGIGRWTVEMFLMFSLARLDVWPSGDLGVRRGWSLIKGEPMLEAKEIEPLGDPFRPYRSVVAWYCWRATELLKEPR